MLFIILLLLFPFAVWSQETNSITSRISRTNYTSQEYRPGLNFQSTDINPTGSPVNLINSSSVSIEYTEVGRIGAIRLDGAATPPIMAIDGFVVKDPSINQGQMLLDLLPYDFAERVDIYKQNLSPFGINAGSLIDFRLPINFEQSTSLLVQAGTTANLYTKIQGEIPFKDGTTFFGVLGDFGFKDYYYGINGGKDFDIYQNSTFNRTSLISKTIWKNLEFLIAHTYTEGFSESSKIESFPLDTLTRNNLITGIRYSINKIVFSANYTFYNQLVQNDSYTNDYLNHQFNAQVSVKDRINRYYYQVSLGYEINNTEDGVRASHKNYLGVPKYGEHFFNLATEFGFSLYKEEDNPTLNFDLHLALNQILSVTGLYTPIPMLTMGIRHKNGVYFSTYISRIYILPDLTTAYGFGNPEPSNGRTILPKDGLRSGVELGFNQIFGRFYTGFSYSWLDKGFRLAEDNLTLINSDNVTAFSAEIGMELKTILQANIYRMSTSLSWNDEKDDKQNFSSIIPIWKWITVLSVGGIDDSWLTSLSYRLTACTPNGRKLIDKNLRHYLDLYIRYRWFIVNILNLANQSYRSIPNNPYSPYNPGIRAEFGIEYKF
ncbi:MAG: hypothetical protein ACRC0X_08005 [Brevinema sp.]